MRVVFLEDVPGVALGGDVKEVKNGFARNYLIPQGMAVPAKREALKRVERLKQDAEVNRLKTLTDMKALGEQLDGTQVNVEMRAGVSGRLYGSVTSAIVADELAKLAGREMDRRAIDIHESIREIGAYDLPLRLHPEVNAHIRLLVHPAGTDPVEFMSTLEAEAAEAATKVDESASGSEEPAGDAAAEDDPAGDAAAEDDPAGDAAAEDEPEGDVDTEDEPAGDAAAEEPAKDD